MHSGGTVCASACTALGSDASAAVPKLVALGETTDASSLLVCTINVRLETALLWRQLAHCVRMPRQCIWQVRVHGTFLCQCAPSLLTHCVCKD